VVSGEATVDANRRRNMLEVSIDASPVFLGRADQPTTPASFSGLKCRSFAVVDSYYK
jgi:hypothetical protein